MEMEKEQLTEVVLPGVVEPEGLLLRTGPVPAPAAGQAVIRMEAAGVSGSEFVPGYPTGRRPRGSVGIRARAREVSDGDGECPVHRPRC
jgi:hypothetical protein